VSAIPEKIPATASTMTGAVENRLVNACFLTAMTFLFVLRFQTATGHVVTTTAPSFLFCR